MKILEFTSVVEFAPSGPSSPPAPAAPIPTPPSSAPSGPNPDTRRQRQRRVQRGRITQNVKAAAGKGVGALWDMISQRRNEPYYNSLGRTNALKVLGGGLRIIRLVGYYDLYVGYQTDMAIAQDLLSKQVEKEEITREQAEADYNEVRKRALAVMVTTIAASSLLRYAIRTALGIRWLIRILALGGSLATGGLSLVFLLGSEIAMTYFLNWASSDEGRKTIAEYVCYKILADTPFEFSASDIIGPLATKAVDKMNDVVSAAKEKITGKKDPNKQDSGKPEKPGTTGQGGQPADGKWKPGETKPGGKTGKEGDYSKYAQDPELKKALQAAGL